MNLKERKLIGHFLEMLHERMEHKLVNRISSVYLDYFDRKELIEIVLWANDAYDRNLLAEKTEEQLLELIGDEMYVLSHTIYKWKEGIAAVPKLEQGEVQRFFDQIQIDPIIYGTSPWRNGTGTIPVTIIPYWSNTER